MQATLGLNRKNRLRAVFLWLQLRLRQYKKNSCPGKFGGLKLEKDTKKPHEGGFLGFPNGRLEIVAHAHTKEIALGAFNTRQVFGVVITCVQGSAFAQRVTRFHAKRSTLGTAAA